MPYMNGLWLVRSPPDYSFGYFEYLGMLENSWQVTKPAL